MTVGTNSVVVVESEFGGDLGGLTRRTSVGKGKRGHMGSVMCVGVSLENFLLFDSDSKRRFRRVTLVWFRFECNLSGPLKKILRLQTQVSLRLT